MEQPISIVIADDHVITRDGLRVLVESDRDLKLVGEAADGQQLLEAVRKHRPDVVITDLRMPVMDGYEAIKAMVAEGIDRILIYTMADSPASVNEALYAGALGCVVKNASRREIIEGIKAVYQRREYYCPATRAMITTPHAQRRNPNATYPDGLFDSREIAIIKMICMNKSSEDIADALHISKRTIDGIRRQIRRKMQARSLVDLIKYAFDHGICKSCSGGN